jgi:aldehyde dehydrogenase (NAD+)
MNSTPDIPAAVDRLRATFSNGRTRPLAWRREQLAALKRLLQQHQDDVLEVLRQDLGKPPIEALASEIAFVTHEVDALARGLPRWMKPERVPTPLMTQPGRSWIIREPRGVVLVIAPWNYPVQLTLTPLAGALAAGNCAVVKPSELAPASSALLARLLPRYLDPEAVRVIEGSVAETTTLLEQPFDHIFYTGNATVGRIVMTAAARHLTPVTLELGGKCPALVDRDIDVPIAARRLAWAKFFNAGQTCVAPDYILAHARVEPDLIAQLRLAVTEFFGPEPKASPDFARIINARHLQRLTHLLTPGETVCGGDVDPAQHYLAPTILRNVPEDAPVMRDEIFGPILPVLTVPDMEAAIDFVNRRPQPLALYLFSNDRQAHDQVLARTSSGGVAINHAILQLSVPGLPFGGVGPSGLGAYHGRASFETFSHRKSVLRKPLAFDVPLLYPPYTDTKTRWLKRLL